MVILANYSINPPTLLGSAPFLCESYTHPTSDSKLDPLRRAISGLRFYKGFTLTSQCPQIKGTPFNSAQPFQEFSTVAQGELGK